MVDTGFPVVWCMSDTRNDATYDNDSPVVDGRVRRHLLSGAQRGVFDRNMALMEALESGEPIGRLARRYRVSRQWVSTLRRRYAAEGEAGLLPRSRRPTRVHNRTDEATRRLIAEVRERLHDQGWDCGARSIRHALDGQCAPVPSVSTIHRVLRDMGLVDPEPRKRPRSSYIRFEAELPNETWQSDFTHRPDADGVDAQIVTWLDDHSRMVLLSRAVRSVTGEDVASTFLECCGLYGTPASTLTDNGTVYTSRLVPGSRGPGMFERLLAEHGVRQKNGRPGHPTTQGKIERWHRTLKQWLAARPRARDIAELQEQIDEFVHAYNRRVHSSLNGMSPFEAYRARDKAGPDPLAADNARAERDVRRRLRERGRPGPDQGPARRPSAFDKDLNTPAERSTVTANGVVNYHRAGKARQFYIGTQHTGLEVETLITNGNALITDTTTGQILLDQPFDTNNVYQKHAHTDVNHAPTTRKPKR